MLLHQDAFAADYQDDAGLRGKEVRVIGKNGSTLCEEAKTE